MSILADLILSDGRAVSVRSAMEFLHPAGEHRCPWCGRACEPVRARHQSDRESVCSISCSASRTNSKVYGDGTRGVL